MKTFTFILTTLICLSSFALAQYAPSYKIKLVFQQKGYQQSKKKEKDKDNAKLLYKWHRTVKFRDDFHFFLDKAPLKKGFNTGFIVGVIYPKKDGLYCTLSLGGSKKIKSEESGNSYSIGSVRFFKIPKTMKFDLPLSVDSGFQKCEVTIIPIKKKNKSQ